MYQQPISSALGTFDLFLFLAKALPAALLCFLLFPSAMLWKAALAACNLNTVLVTPGSAKPFFAVHIFGGAANALPALLPNKWD